MTEWNNQLLTGGSGFIGYRLMIEGWPHQWVTDPSIVHQSGILTRFVYPGLSYDGLRISERMVLREAWPEVDGMTLRIVASDANEDTINGLTRDAQVVATLVNNLSASDTNWVTQPVLPLGYYHLASECVLCDVSGGSITRGFWDSEPQEHAALDYSLDNAVPIYSWPPTMEGRRAYLYAYGPSDDPASDGQIVWRGVVTRPPRMDSDGLSWMIELGSIVSKFDQNLGASDEIEYKLRGVYHSTSCPMSVLVQTDMSDTLSMPRVDVFGFYESESSFALAVGYKLGLALPMATGHASHITSIVPSYDEGKYKIWTTFNPAYSASLADFPLRIAVWDALDGHMQDYGGTGDPQRNGQPPYSGQAVYFAGNADGAFYVDGQAQQPPWEYPLPEARTLVGSISSPFHARASTDPTWPNNRVYLQSVDGLSVGDYMAVSNGEDEHRTLKITAINTTYRYITVQLIGAGGLYISGDSKMVPLRSYGEDTNWCTFIKSIVAQAPSANLGKTPWITDRDVDTSQWQSYWDSDAYPFTNYWRHRVYQFSKQVTVRSVFAPELMVTGWMARLSLDGRLDVALMPFISPQRSANWVLTDDEILLPAEEMVGIWPTWEAQSDGLVNIAKVRLGYNPNTDEFDEAADYNVRMTQSIAEHKSGNRALQTIEIRSQPASVPLWSPLKYYRIAWRFPITAEAVVDMVMPYLRCLSQDYAIVTVAVPFTLFPVLVGDIVDVTSAFIPNGLGGRGVVSKKAICVGRVWNLDPAANQMGTLTLWFARDSGRVAGYAPTGRVASQVDNGGGAWTLQFSASEPLNVAWSESTDGLIAKHFAIGDAIQLVQADTITPGVVHGIITAKPDATHITVQLDASEAAWVPSSVKWNLRFLIAVGEDLHILATLRQAAYCWIADSSGGYAGGFIPNFPGPAREFV